MAASSTPTKTSELERKDDSEMVSITEGKATVWFPKTNSVFYNPVQEYNRDISTAALSVFAEETLKKKGLKVQYENKASEGTEDSNQSALPGVKCEEGLRVLEALAASGLRSVRFALEVPGLHSITANDYSEAAVGAMKYNVERNGVGHLVTPSLNDAALLMYTHKNPKDRFDVVDLDPYGSPALFLDASIQAVKDGGLLFVTCTDMAVLCGNHPETCFTKYGSMSLRTPHCHELALRIVLSSLARHASVYGRYIVPLISLSIDFYIRIMVRVYTGASKAKILSSQQGMLYSCTGCESFYIQPMAKVTKTGKNGIKFTASVGPPVDRDCQHCNHHYHVCGPIWSDPIHQTEFVSSLLNHVKSEKHRYGTGSRLVGMLSMISEELDDAPLYYVIDQLSSTVRTSAPPLLKFRSAVLSAGYRISQSHANKNAIKTDAPPRVIWDIMRCWERDFSPVKRDRFDSRNPALAILSKTPELNASFDIRQDANPASRSQGLSRFPMNPEPNWGPKTKAKRSFSPVADTPGEDHSGSDDDKQTIKKSKVE